MVAGNERRQQAGTPVLLLKDQKTTLLAALRVQMRKSVTHIPGLKCYLRRICHLRLGRRPRATPVHFCCSHLRLTHCVFSAVDETIICLVSMSLSLTFDIAHRFNDAAVPYAHWIDAAQRIGLALTPPLAPSDDRAVAAHHDVFEVEVCSWCGRDLFRPSDAGLEANMPGAIRRGLSIFDHIVLGDQIRQSRGIVTLKHIIESPYDLRSLIGLHCSAAAPRSCWRTIMTG